MARNIRWVSMAVAHVLRAVTILRAGSRQHGLNAMANPGIAMPMIIPVTWPRFLPGTKTGARNEREAEIGDMSDDPLGQLLRTTPFSKALDVMAVVRSDHRAKLPSLDRPEFWRCSCGAEGSLDPDRQQSMFWTHLDAQRLDALRVLGWAIA